MGLNLSNLIITNDTRDLMRAWRRISGSIDSDLNKRPSDSHNLYVKIHQGQDGVAQDTYVINRKINEAY